MTKKLVETDIKLGRNTVLFEAFSQKLVETNIGIGGTHIIPDIDKLSAIIIYYSVINGGYYNQFIIPGEVNSWFYDTHPQGSIYVRLYQGKIEVSSNSTGAGRVLGYIIIN